MRAYVLAITLLLAALVVGVFVRAQPRVPLHTDTIRYYIAEGEPDSAYRPEDRQLAEWALAAWEASAGWRWRFEPAPEEEADIRLYWVPAGAGLYGEVRPMFVGGRPVSEVYIRPDTTALGREIAERAAADPLYRDTIVYLTCVHELGHALGLRHTDVYDDVMYAFGYGGDIPGFFGRYRAKLTQRSDIALHSGLSEGDLEQLRKVLRIEALGEAP
jgi:hypothetical protein